MKKARYVNSAFCFIDHNVIQYGQNYLKCTLNFFLNSFSSFSNFFCFFGSSCTLVALDFIGGRLQNIIIIKTDQIKYANVRFKSLILYIASYGKALFTCKVMEREGMNQHHRICLGKYLWCKDIWRQKIELVSQLLWKHYIGLKRFLPLFPSGVNCGGGGMLKKKDINIWSFYWQKTINRLSLELINFSVVKSKIKGSLGNRTQH